MDNQRSSEDIPASSLHDGLEFVEAVEVAEDIGMSLRLRDSVGFGAELGHEFTPSFRAIVIVVFGSN